MAITDDTDRDVQAILGDHRSTSRLRLARRSVARALEPWAGLGGFVAIIVASTFLIPRFVTPSTTPVSPAARPAASVVTNLMVATAPSAPAIPSPRTAEIDAMARSAEVQRPRRLHPLKASPPRLYARAAPRVYVRVTLRRYKASRAPERITRRVWRPRIARMEPALHNLAPPSPLVSSPARSSDGVRLRDRQRLSVARAERTEALDDIWLIRQK